MNFLNLKSLLACKLRFTFPKVKKVLIYDESNSDFIFSLIKKEQCEILHTRLEEINIPILLLSILTFNKKKLTRKYVCSYIKYVGPKVVITFVDNKLSFYELKKYFSNIFFVSIQNGLRNYGSECDTSKKIDNLKKKELLVDYFFAFNKSYQEFFSQFLKGKIITAGSLKNNSIPINNKKNFSLKKLLYISQFRANAVNNIDKNFNKKLKTGQKLMLPEYFLLKSEKKLIPLIAEYCKSNKIFLQICGCLNDKEELFFYKSLIKDDFKNWEFYPKKSMETTYSMLDQATAVAFIDSTLGYEALSRSTPTACFSVRGEFLDNFDGCKFGRPAKYDDDGPFWCNELSKSNLNNILNFVLNVSEDDWKKIKDQYTDKIAFYDPMNTKFKEIMNTINISLNKKS